MTALEKQYTNRKTIAAGIILIGVGVLLFMRNAGVLIPHWLMSWQLLLIVIGVGIGVSSNFTKLSSWVLILLGGFFMLDTYIIYPIELRQFFWPFIIIIFGIVVMVKPKRRFHQVC